LLCKLAFIFCFIFQSTIIIIKIKFVKESWKKWKSEQKEMKLRENPKKIIETQ
jgi:hypothetical protein